MTAKAAMKKADPKNEQRGAKPKGPIPEQEQPLFRNLSSVPLVNGRTGRTSVAWKMFCQFATGKKCGTKTYGNHRTGYDRVQRGFCV